MSPVDDPIELFMELLSGGYVIIDYIEVYTDVISDYNSSKENLQ